jgi:hypothetical protein
MKNELLKPALFALMTAGVSATAPFAMADEPCGEGEDALGECRLYIEINATDGDIGIHALFDGEGWNNAQIRDTGDVPIFNEDAYVGTSLGMQQLTENFFESTEPACEAELAEEGEPHQTGEQFLTRFPAGAYDFILDGGDQTGTTLLSHNIPAAPAEVDFNGHDITWEYGEDFGECTTWPAEFEPATEDEIVGYEVVMEPDEDGLTAFTFVARVGPEVNKIRVPKAYLESLPADVPLKMEVGAIERRPNGSFGNQTFTEENGFCNNSSQEQCPEEEDEEED